MQRWVREIFADNIMMDVSLKCWAASTSKANTINIKMEKIILDFFMFYNTGVTEYASDETELNCICQ